MKIMKKWKSSWNHACASHIYGSCERGFSEQNQFKTAQFPKYYNTRRLTEYQYYWLLFIIIDYYYPWAVGPRAQCVALVVCKQNKTQTWLHWQAEGHWHCVGGRYRLSLNKQETFSHEIVQRGLNIESAKLYFSQGDSVITHHMIEFHGTLHLFFDTSKLSVLKHDVLLRAQQGTFCRNVDQTVALQSRVLLPWPASPGQLSTAGHTGTRTGRL